MRRIFIAILCGILFGVFVPITVSYISFTPLLIGIIWGILFGLVYYGLYSRLPTKNPLVKSIALGLFWLFLPTFTIISFFETMFIFPPEITDVSPMFYLISSAFFGLVMMIPSVVFGVAYWVVSEEEKFRMKINKIRD